ncbi:MAG: DUF433 domain-containing protein [Nitrososphaerota archaeon]
MRIEVNDYIIIDTEICHGKPTFKGTRIMVYQVLEMLAAGYNEEEILSEFPSLSKEHIKAALEYASKRLSERIVELT